MHPPFYSLSVHNVSVWEKVIWDSSTLCDIVIALWNWLNSLALFLGAWLKHHTGFWHCCVTHHASVNTLICYLNQAVGCHAAVALLTRNKQRRHREGSLLNNLCSKRALVSLKSWGKFVFFTFWLLHYVNQVDTNMQWVYQRFTENTCLLESCKEKGKSKIAVGYKTPQKNYQKVTPFAIHTVVWFIVYIKYCFWQHKKTLMLIFF